VCTTGVQNTSRFARNQSLLFDQDYGTPQGLCKETRPPSFTGETYQPGSGVFERERSKAGVKMQQLQQLAREHHPQGLNHSCSS
jgi:hypothetical protein